MADGFLGRWSQRKQAVRSGQSLTEPQPPAPKPSQPPGSPGRPGSPGSPAPASRSAAPVTAASPAQGAAGAPGQAAPAATPAPAPLPTPPTLAEAERLTPASDFKPFVARSVAPEVRNAAMKKLFADPQFNVMDGLDIYIDDYAKPDPLPLSMLRQMASAQFLNLFEDEAQNPAPSVAQCALPAAAADDAPVNNPGPEPDSDHDHIDLRLQPNHAAGPPAPGRGPE